MMMRKEVAVVVYMASLVSAMELELGDAIKGHECPVEVYDYFALEDMRY